MYAKGMMHTSYPITVQSAIKQHSVTLAHNTTICFSIWDSYIVSTVNFLLHIWCNDDILCKPNL